MIIWAQGIENALFYLLKVLLNPIEIQLIIYILIINKDKV